MKVIILIYSVIITGGLVAQNVGVNANGVTPDASAMLDVKSTDKGLLIPRVDIANLTTAAPVTAPVNSLLVYNTNTTTGIGYYYWNATTKWTKLVDASTPVNDHDWYEVGTTTAPDNINDDIFTQGKVGIGVTVPIVDFHVGSSKESLFGHHDDFQRGTVHIKGGENEGSGRTGKKSTLYLKNGFGTATVLHIEEPGTSSGHIGLFVGNQDKTEATLMTVAKNVGIGTIAPDTKLTISAPSGRIIKIISQSLVAANASKNYIGGYDSNDDRFWYLGDGSSAKRVILAAGSATVTDYDMGFELGGVERIRILQNGNVGINTPNPTEKLEINGSIKITDGTQGVGKVLVSDAIGKGSWKDMTPIIVLDGVNSTSVTIASGSTVIVSNSVVVTEPGLYYLSGNLPINFDVSPDADVHIRVFKDGVGNVMLVNHFHGLGTGSNFVWHITKYFDVGTYNLRVINNSTNAIGTTGGCNFKFSDYVDID